MAPPGMCGRGGRIVHGHTLRCHTDAMPQPVIVVVGPTAAGKSELSLRLARSLGGEVVNADSMQLYRGMDIGTAKLPPDQWEGIPHHLLDIWEVTKTASVFEYQRLARGAIEAIHARGRVPVVVGGSGLYVRAILDNLRFPGTDPALRDQLRRRAGRDRRRGPARQAGPAGPGRGRGDPAQQRAQDRPGPRGDRAVGPAVQRHAARL